MAAFTPEWVAALLRNEWPVSSGMGGRFHPEYAFGELERHGEGEIAQFSPRRDLNGEVGEINIEGGLIADCSRSRTAY